jgi:hypothetical protein
MCLGCLAILFGLAVVIFGSPVSALAWLRGERVVLEPAVFDLGPCQTGERHAVELRLRNRSEEPVRAIGGTTSCVCVATKGFPIDVPPGEERTVPVDVVVTGNPGRFVQTVTIMLDGKSLRMVQAQLRAQIVFADERP